MKPEPKILWESDDFKLQQEFADVSEAWRESKPAVRVVPAALDRLIHKHAGGNVGSELMASWIFGAVPKLSLAAAILFGVGLMFVTSLERSADGGDSSDPSVSDPPVVTSPGLFDSRIPGLIDVDNKQQSVASLEQAAVGDYQIDFQFSLDANLKAIDAVVTARCLKGDEGICESLAVQNTARLDQIARMMLSRRTFDPGTRRAKVEVSSHQLLQE